MDGKDGRRLPDIWPLSPSKSVFSTSAKKPLTAWPGAFFEVVLRGTMVLMAPPRSISPGTMGSHLAPWSMPMVAGHDALGHVCSGEDDHLAR